MTVAPIADHPTLRLEREKWRLLVQTRSTAPDVTDQQPFQRRQHRVALRNCGSTRADLIEEYIARDGFEALALSLEHNDPTLTLETLKRSGLRGRTGAGFPTGLKWQLVSEASGNDRSVVCNANEGGSGATLSTLLIQNDPFTVIEGLTIAAFAVGSQHGYISLPADQDRAMKRLSRAVEQSRAHGLLGENILGSNLTFDIEVHPSSGALVLRDETALISSIEGRRATPRPRPPFPSNHGLFAEPTLICHAETLAAVPPVILDGGDDFSAIGTRHSCGTKAFFLTGCVQRTGLIEVPMGTPLRTVITEIGGGPSNGSEIRAIQIGGPSGGFIPMSLADTTIDYESLHDLGVSMGSGTLTAIPADACIVDLVRFFMGTISDESCGKCPPCRIGTRVMLNILERITNGEGTMNDLELLKGLSAHIRSSSLCNLGQSSPNTLLSALRHFQEEFEAHITDRRCPAGICNTRGAGR